MMAKNEITSLSDGLLSQITAVIRHYIRTEGAIEAATEQNATKMPTRFRTHRIIFDEMVGGGGGVLGAIAEEIDLDEPNATVCEWSQSLRKYTQTKLRLHVISFGEAYTRDDAAWAVPQDGNWIAAGCPQPVPGRPEPPWWPEGEDWPPEESP